LGCFETCENRKSKGAKGFKGGYLKIDMVEVRVSRLRARHELAFYMTNNPDMSLAVGAFGKSPVGSG
jgi:hypothetical protein